MSDLRDPDGLKMRLGPNSYNPQLTWQLLGNYTWERCYSQAAYHLREVTCDAEGWVTGLELPGANNPELLYDSARQVYYTEEGGVLPASWAMSFPRLEYLNLGENNLRGELPVAWSSLSSLKFLLLDRNLLDGTLPAEWSHASSLVEVNVRSNHRIHGSLPDAWSALQHLDLVSAWDNNLTGSIPSSWSMNRLLVADNLNMCGPSTCRIPYLSMHRTQVGILSCTIPGAADPEPELNRTLYQEQQNVLTRDLQALGVEVTSIKWNVSSSFTFHCFDYRRQHAGSADKGAPFVVFDCEGWARALCLGDVGATGQLPDAWGAALPKLISIDLSYNKGLTGTLPESWSTMTSLYDLHLAQPTNDGRGLSGTLPTAWSNMVNLRELTLDRNRVEGTLPAEWSVLQIGSQRLPPSGFAPTLHLFDNKLEGPIPRSWSGAWELELAGNADMCGPVDHALNITAADVLGTQLGDACPGVPPHQPGRPWHHAFSQGDKSCSSRLLALSALLPGAILGYGFVLYWVITRCCPAACSGPCTRAVQSLTGYPPAAAKGQGGEDDEQASESTRLLGPRTSAAGEDFGAGPASQQRGLEMAGLPPMGRTYNKQSSYTRARQARTSSSSGAPPRTSSTGGPRMSSSGNPGLMGMGSGEGGGFGMLSAIPDDAHV